ncbi:hypothetical protein D0Z07_9331 [Hyphodiscus hymeniophilus]|uniref:Lccl domain-containing protein n=1 Tax=Hyphodiscus hymeniophilus TaxID=353542 RepID=A0A9P6VDF3_9HELO|nr:hypothetical protein D0Z07_9331 [Hyphodiscus hymeniophilus]
MAAPPTANLKNLSGIWVTNKVLSDNPEKVLTLQGIPWLKRKIIGLATITLHITAYVPADTLSHVDITYTLTGGIKSTPELRTLDWQEREYADETFGNLVARSKWLADVDGDVSADGGPLQLSQKEGWCIEKVGPNGEAFIQSYLVNKKDGWSAEQIWGFAVIGDSRRHIRRIAVKKGKETKTVLQVYDWVGEMPNI